MNDEPRESSVPAEPPPRHHTPERSSLAATARLAAASDVGHRHEVNQDAYRIAHVDISDPVTLTHPTASVAVIADGVSSAMDSDIASDQAVAAAMRRIESHLRDDPLASPQELAEVFAEAFAMANLAVLGAHGGAVEAGSCTLIASVLTDNGVTVANIGDSRAYWVGDDGHSLRLSIDDSIAQVRIEMGMAPELAEQGVHSHAITRWIGPNATDVTPRVLSYTPRSPGWVLLCSDGLWNYSSDADQIARLVRHAIQADQVEAAATYLVDWALAQGGRDNVTVALARWEPSSLVDSAEQEPGPENAATTNESEQEDDTGTTQP